MSERLLTPEEATALYARLPTMSSREKIETLDMLEKSEAFKTVRLARTNMIEFAKYVYPGFKVGPHHRKLARIFDAVLKGEKKRVIINIAPRMGKSEFSSYLFPAYFLGNYPDKKIIMGTHTAGLSEDFGRRVRNLLEDDQYHELFPKTEVADDQKAAGKWSTSAGGQYYAAGVGGALAGRGADLFVIDDPHALAINTLIATPQGFKTVAELSVGDEVFGPDGAPTKILAKSEVRHDRPLYEVETDDGEVIHCDGGHLWTYHSDTALSKHHLTKTATTRELAEWDKPNRPTLPRHGAVQYTHNDELPIDPYVLGAWLGDGTATAAKITSHPDDQPFMRAQFEAAGYITTDQGDPYNFGVLGLWGVLKDTGLLGNKHIPQKYLTASIEQRIALLQGLMDTDGTVTTAGQCSFQNTSLRLVEAVRELLHSLGHKCRICVYYDNRDRYITRQPDYRLNFKMANACRMPRKAARTHTTQDKRRRTITVRPTTLSGSVQCITVARSDGLFLAGRGYVVTHNSEQDVKANSRLAFDSAWSWFQTGPLQRLMPDGAIIVIMTRWSLLDLTGRLVQYQVNNPNSPTWEIVELPAILHENTDNEKSLWPEQWPLEALKSAKSSMDPRYWNAQYMQQPTSDTAAIISRKHWRIWESDKPPICEYIIQSWDTAHETKTTSDYSACTTWGVWYNEEENDKPQLILLDAFKGRIPFPELKQTAFKHWKEWQPDAFIVEKKAAGGPLIQELRNMGIPVQEFTPSRGNDKMVRVQAVADLFSSGMVWAPDTRWAREVIEEVAAFPVGENDDFVDTTSQALLRFRQGGFITLDTDETEEPRFFKRRSAAYY